MIKLNRSVFSRNNTPLTDSACEEIKSLYAENDQLDENISLFNSISFQSWAHQCFDSTTNPSAIGPAATRMWNRYDGLDNGQGVYPADRTNPMILKDGKFRISEVGLPYIAGTEPPVELAADYHRVNENAGLKGFHLMWVKIHNKRIEEHGDYELAKQETIATMNLVTKNEAEVITGLSFKQMLDHVRIKDFNNSLEFVFGVGRWAHAQMPDRLNDRPIFEKVNSVDVDMESMLIERSRVLNLGCSTAMRNMDHLPAKPFDILERTFSRHNQLQLASFQDLAHQMKMPIDKDIVDGCPIWPGILLEAQNQGDGLLGPVGARSVADAVVASLVWGVSSGQGLWHDRWKGAPNTSEEIVDYAD